MTSNQTSQEGQIPEEMREAIFKPFVQAEPTSMRRKEPELDILIKPSDRRSLASANLTQSGKGIKQPKRQCSEVTGHHDETHQNQKRACALMQSVSEASCGSK
ncbi:MAG: hypothetical protein ACNA7O_20395, partial [Rhodobacterales bacterium]